MVMRGVARLCLLLAASLPWAGTAGARHAVTVIDGCSLLASVVYAEVLEAGLGYSTRTTVDPLHPGRDEITLCDQATRSVTRAFTSALQQANVYVSWGFHQGFSGDHCLGHVLAQCHPVADPAMPPLRESERSFLARSWQAVRDAVHYRMALYPGSDVARFNGSELRRSIRQYLRASADGSRPQRPVQRWPYLTAGEE